MSQNGNADHFGTLCIKGKRSKPKIKRLERHKKGVLGVNFKCKLSMQVDEDP